VDGETAFLFVYIHLMSVRDFWSHLQNF